MPWQDNEWTAAKVADVEYILSPQKQTPGLELTCHHPENGEIKGVWWMTNTLNQKTGIPMWKVVYQRLLLLGCTEEELKKSDTWVQHIKETIVGKQVSVMPETDNYGTKASAIGVSTGGGGGFHAQAAGGASPFAVAPMSDNEDLPF